MRTSKPWPGAVEGGLVTDAEALGQRCHCNTSGHRAGPGLDQCVTVTPLATTVNTKSTLQSGELFRVLNLHIDHHHYHCLLQGSNDAQRGL